MNTRENAEEYRLSHWAEIIKERSESGASIKKYCEDIGINESSYYYWLKKLRDAACEGLTKIQSKQQALTLPVFTEVKLPALQQSEQSAPCSVHQNQVCVEIGRVRLTASGEYPVDKLVELLRVVGRTCC